MVIEIIILLAGGAFAGFLAGLLGIGGGIVLIPILVHLLGDWGVGIESSMHISVATSLFVIVLTNISSVRAHNKRGAVAWSLVREWWLAIAIGSLIGSAVAQYLSGPVLVYIFVGLVALLAVKMLLPLDDVKLAKDVPSGLIGRLPPAIIGGLSAIMGIGGGSFNVPYMTLFGRPIHQAVGTAATLGLIISGMAAVGYLLGSPGDVGVDYLIGYVHLPSALIFSLSAVLVAPLGARASHALPKRALSAIFGVFLVVAGSRLLLSVL